MITPNHDLMLRVRDAFLDQGYDRLTMVELARACAFTRRALYHYFNSKESAYRAMLRHFNDVAIADGLAAGAAVRLRQGSALDVLAETLDIRYGDTRRRLNGSAYALELNAEAFRRARDIMIEVAIAFHVELERLIRELIADGSLTLRPDMSVATLAQLLTDAARGVNQSLPPIASEDYGWRYRQMVAAILFGASSDGQARDGGRTASKDAAEASARQPLLREARR